VTGNAKMKRKVAEAYYNLNRQRLLLFCSSFWHNRMWDAF